VSELASWGTMSDTALTLRPLQPGDCDRLLSWIDSEDALYQWSGARAFSWPLDRGQLLRDLAVAGDAELTFAATEASGEMVGHVRLEVNRHHRLGFIGRVAVAPDQRGRGLGTALMRALARHAFDELALHRLNLVVYTFNTAAIACYRAVGFEVEGRMRDSTLGSDGYWDGLTMALLEPQYRRPSVYGEGVRIAGPRDAEPIAALLSALGHPHDRAQAAERLREWSAEPAGTVLVAESEDGAVGFVAVQLVRSFECPGSVARIAALSAGAVEPDAAVARRLRDAARAWAAERGCTELGLSAPAGPGA
jgi:RimJ/RimL family protein N-acetyltransferase